MNDLDVRSPLPPATAANRSGDPLGPPQVRWTWWRSRNHRSRLRTRPLLTPAPRGRLRLPGLRVETTLVEAPDPYRRPCGLVLVPATGHVSMALDVELPDKAADDALPTEGLGAWLDAAMVWLARLADEPGLAGCALVLQQVPEHRGGRQVLVQPTWHIAGLEGRTDPAAQAVEVVARVPELVRSLHQGGIGAARPLPADELAAVVAAAAAAGPNPRPSDAADTQGPRLTRWGDAGPREHSESWDRFQHCGAVSVTWSMSGVAPEALLPGVVSLVTHPLDDGQVRVTVLRRPGDGVLRLAALVTATSRTPDDGLPGARLPEILPASSRPWLRLLYGAQAAGFAAGLPTGVLLDLHAAPPTLLGAAE
jgi:hypothetical protein